MATPSIKHETLRIDLADGNFVEFSLAPNATSPDAINELRINARVAGNDFASTVQLDTENSGRTRIRVVQPEGRYALYAQVFEGATEVYNGA